MRIMRTAAAACAAIVALATSACSSSNSSANADGRPTTTSAQGATTTIPHASEGYVLVTLAAVGGPAPGLPRPMRGTVVFRNPNSTMPGGGSPAVTRTVGTDGTVQLSLQPGLYSVTGRSPLYESNRGVCRADQPLRISVSSAGVQAPMPQHVYVYCQER